MSRPPITGKTVVAGVVGSPVDHSLSPLLHNAWLEAAGIDGVYVAFSPPADNFAAFVRGLRGGAVRGLNVTVPFKEEALRLADQASDAAKAAGAANLLVFARDGAIIADNTDGVGMLGALRAQAPGFDLKDSRVLVLGAGGAARGAVTALIAAGVSRVQVLNRTFSKAQVLAASMGAGVEAVDPHDAATAFAANTAVINATSTSLSGDPEVYPLDHAPPDAVIMHMTYKPVRPAFLEEARQRNLTTVDGLEMLIAQAIPSFQAFFGQAPDPAVDVRTLALKALAER